MVILGTVETRCLYLVTSTLLTVAIETMLMTPAATLINYVARIFKLKKTHFSVLQK